MITRRKMLLIATIGFAAIAFNVAGDNVAELNKKRDETYQTYSAANRKYIKLIRANMTPELQQAWDEHSKNAGNSSNVQSEIMKADPRNAPLIAAYEKARQVSDADPKNDAKRKAAATTYQTYMGAWWKYANEYEKTPIWKKHEEKCIATNNRVEKLEAELAANNPELNEAREAKLQTYKIFKEAEQKWLTASKKK